MKCVRFNVMYEPMRRRSVHTPNARHYGRPIGLDAPGASDRTAPCPSNPTRSPTPAWCPAPNPAPMPPPPSPPISSSKWCPPAAPCPALDPFT